MSTLLLTDIIVATAFKDKFDFYKMAYNLDSESSYKKLIDRICISIADCMKKKLMCAEISFGKAFCSSTEEDFAYFFYENRKFFVKTKSGFKLNYDAIKDNLGNFDLNEFFKQLLKNSLYSSEIYETLGFN